MELLERGGEEGIAASKRVFHNRFVLDEFYPAKGPEYKTFQKLLAAVNGFQVAV